MKKFLINLSNKTLEYLWPKKKINDARVHYFPQSRILFFAITSQCNFNCPHCIRRLDDKNKTVIKDLPISIFKIALKEGKKMNFNTILLVGGEPILHPQFKEIITLIRKYNYKFLIISNGWLYKEYWEGLEYNRENLIDINLSLDGATAEVHDNIRNKKGSFERVIEAINFYKRRKIDIGIKTLISKRNRHQIEEILKLCLKLKVKRITFISEIPSRNSDFPPKERAKALKEILVFQRRFRGVLRIQPAASLFQNIECKTGVQFCSPLDGQKIYIDWDGGMLFCPDIFFRCENKPLIQEVGFEKAYKITLDTINEIKKRRLYDLLNNSIEANTTLCDYCDKHIESCLDLAKEKYRIN